MRLNKGSGIYLSALVTAACLGLVSCGDDDGPSPTTNSNDGGGTDAGDSPSTSMTSSSQASSSTSGSSASTGADSSTGSTESGLDAGAMSPDGSMPGSETDASADTDASSQSDASPDTDASADGSTPMSTNDAAPPDGGAAFDPQVPPTEAALVEAWLNAGYYNDWVCEAEATTKTAGDPGIHVHGASSRICANVLLAASTAPGASGEFPKGVAAVKEVYDENDTLLGRFVEVKTQAESASGDGWYWYKDAGGVADGFGLAGCTGCHGASASDEGHPGAGDYVYSQQTDVAQLPPVGDTAAMAAWLDLKLYDDWACEETATLKTDGAAGIHVHGTNRVCTNARLADGQLDNGVWPAGVASVKELFAADGGAAGVAVSVKVNSDSAAGDGWYWYAGEDVQGFGFAGCTGCHNAAGTDADHPGADSVYFRNTP